MQELKTLILNIDSVGSTIVVDSQELPVFSEVNSISEAQRELVVNEYDCLLILCADSSVDLTEACEEIIGLNLPTAIVIITKTKIPSQKLLALGVTEILTIDEIAHQNLKQIAEIAVAREGRVRRLLKRVQEQEYSSTHDSVTGLANKNFFHERLNHTITLGQYYDQKFALIICDIDHFTTLNETLGVDAGNEVLRQFASRLSKVLPIEAMISRVDSDEFGIILPNVENTETPGKIASKIIQAIKAPFEIDGVDHFVTVSIGVAVYPEDGASAMVLVQACNTAVKKVKELGRNHYRYFAPGMNAQAIRQFNLSNQIRKAWKEEEFILYYQPKIDLHTHSVTGVEALIRWAHPEMGLVTPNEFLLIIEDTGQVDTMGDWVMRTAIQQHQQWCQSDLGSIPISINMSATQFYHSNFANRLKFYLDKYEMEPSALEIELTEGALMKDPEKVIDALNSVRKLGVGIALDDFGTGYSSLSHLKYFPLNTIKVDQSFVREVYESEADAGIVSAVITMAKSLGKEVVCEGVETQRQCDALVRLGCEHMQGFLFARPNTAHETEKFIRQFEGR